MAAGRWPYKHRQKESGGLVGADPVLIGQTELHVAAIQPTYIVTPGLCLALLPSSTADGSSPTSNDSRWHLDGTSPTANRTPPLPVFDSRVANTSVTIVCL